MVLQAGLYKAKLLGGLGNLTAKFTYLFTLFRHQNSISLKILHRVTSEILVKFDIFEASISSVKYFRISLNLASEILERTIYLFFNFATLVTYKNIVFIVTYCSFA